MNIWGLKKKIERIKFAIKKEKDRERIKILMAKKSMIKGEIKEIKKLREKKKGK